MGEGFTQGPVRQSNVMWDFAPQCPQNDLIGGNQADALRSRYASLAVNHTLFMAWCIGFHDINTGIHAAMAAWIQRPSLTKLGLVPRDFLKTSLWTVADTVRLITAEPEQRILIRNEILQNAQKFLYRIRRVPEACALWQWVFPDRMPDFDDRWNQDGLLFPRDGEYPELSIECIGVGGASTSRHYTRIKEDDMIGKEASRSKVAMQVAKDDHTLATHLLVDPSTSRIDTYGTRWAPHDLYQDMMEREQGLDIFHCGPTDTQGQPLFPSRFPLSVLDDVRRKIGNRNYALQVLNQTPSEGTFELATSDLNTYSKGTDGLGRRYVTLNERDGTTRQIYLYDLFIFQVLDPNITQTSKNARSANIVAGLAAPQKPTEHFSIVILSARAKATTPKGAIELAREDYLFWQPIVFALETVAMQEALKSWMLAAYPDMMIKGVKPDGGASKLARIRAFTPFGENGHLYVHPSMTDFIDEWESFPTGYVDLLDACAYLPYIWTVPHYGARPPGSRGPHELGVGIGDEDLIEANTKETYGGRDAITGY